MTYTEQELVCIAKRENNKKRNYLVVNRLQGKHIPVSPGKAFAMFDQLAGLVQDAYGEERLLLIGFAETATAIGTALAARLDTLYMQTTREEIADVEYLYFSEAHSHAAEQKLVKTDLDKISDKIDRIVFVEDELTTGNTILDIIRVIEEAYGKKFSFSAASLLNGMDEGAEKRYFERGIGLQYLVRTDHRPYAKLAEQFRGDGICHPCDLTKGRAEIREYRASSYRNARRVNRGGELLLSCEELWREIEQRIGGLRQKKILVLGTEECMYPALFAGQKLEEQGNTVLCHSTTRSPIAVSREEAYPLHERYELTSLYERDRRTFLYDIGTYEEVLMITDAPCVEEGLTSLVNALVLCGNRNITVIRWC